MRLATRTWPPARAGLRAPTALLIHGITGSSGTWWRVGPALAAAGWNVIAIDLPGHGDSPPMGRPMNAADWAEAVIETLSGAPVQLAIGHSAGGGTLAELMALDPAVVERAVLEDPPSAPDVPRPEWAAQLEREVETARRDPARFERLLRRQNPAWSPQDATEAVAALVACDIDAIAASERLGMGYRVGERLRDTRIPTLLMLADEERSAFRGDVRRETLAALPSHVTAQHFQTGHVIHRDAFDDYFRAITDWVSR
jgi:pimeloyl-ACP methyl ester carboxylesterase